MHAKCHWYYTHESHEKGMAGVFVVVLCFVCVCVCVCACVLTDPVKAEKFDDGVLRARERMQRLQDERAAEQQQKVEEVGC